MRALDRSAHANRWRGIATAEKSLFAIGMILIALVAADWAGLVAVLALVLGLMIFGARIKPLDIYKAARVPLGFILTGSIAQIVTLGFHDGWPSFGIVSEQGLWTAAFISFRSAVCVSALLFLALTTPLTSIMQCMRRIGLNRDIADIALMMFRVLWILLDCIETGQKSQASRLGHMSWRGMLHSNALMLVALLPRLLDRANWMNVGLMSRGYDGNLKFISRETLSTPTEMIAISIFLCALAVLVRAI